ncbi:MAG: hypothetical protein AAF958_16735 [Planctomycetota bacterium]
MAKTTEPKTPRLRPPATETLSGPDSKTLSGPDTGTLLWIGPRHFGWIADVFEGARRRFDCLAVRTDWVDVAARIPRQIDALVVVRADSRKMDERLLDQLRLDFAAAKFLEFRGPLCEAFYRVPDSRFDGGTHRWDNALAAMDAVFATVTCAHSNPTKLRLVIAATYGDAEPLLEICEHQQIPCTWVRASEMETRAIRGVTEVWWDDSIDAFDSPVDWAARIGHFAGDVRHTWFCGGKMPLEIERARQHGVQKMVAKPGANEDLLGPPAAKDAASLGGVRRAA